MAEHVPIHGHIPVAPPPGAVAPTAPAAAPAPPSGHTVGLPNQTPGFVPPSLEVQLASDPAYAEFLAFKKAKESGTAAPVAEPEPVAPVTDAAPITDPAALLNMVDGAAKADPVLAAQVNLLNRSVPNLDLQRAIGNALVYGDAKLVDLAYIKEVAGDKAADVAVLAGSLVSYAVDAANKAVANVHNAAGGEAQWAAATAAFNKLAPPHMKTVVSTLMNSGDQASIAAAAKTVVDFAKSSGAVTSTTGDLVQTGAAAPAAAQALSKADFQKAIHKLDPNSRNFLQEREALFARRKLGVGLNLQ